MPNRGSDMSQTYDPYHLASPTIYLVKIIIFLVLVALVAAILFSQLLGLLLGQPVHQQPDPAGRC